jgi:hypothetical protein
VFGSSSSQNRVLHRFSVLPGLTLHPLANKKRQGSTGCTAPISRQKWPFKRVGNDIGFRFQRLGPLLAILGVNVLSRLTEQIASTIPSPRVSHPAGRCCATVRIKRLPRIAPVTCKTSHHPLSSVLPFWDKTWDKTPFVPSPKMAVSLTFSDTPREPRVGFEPSVPLGKGHAEKVEQTVCARQRAEFQHPAPAVS